MFILRITKIYKELQVNNSDLPVIDRENIVNDILNNHKMDACVSTIARLCHRLQVWNTSEIDVNVRCALLNGGLNVQCSGWLCEVHEK